MPFPNNIIALHKHLKFKALIFISKTNCNKKEKALKMLNRKVVVCPVLLLVQQTTRYANNYQSDIHKWKREMKLQTIRLLINYENFIIQIIKLIIHYFQDKKAIVTVMEPQEDTTQSHSQLPSATESSVSSLFLDPSEEGLSPVKAMFFYNLLILGYLINCLKIPS